MQLHVAVHIMPNIQRKGLRRNVEDRWFVHIVPKTFYADVHQIFIERSPPCARLRVCKIGEGALPRPHRAYEQRTVRIQNEMFSLKTFFVDPV